MSGRRGGANCSVLAALPIAAGRDRAALAAADHRTLTAVAAAGAVDADLVWVAADIISRIVALRLLVRLLPPLLLLFLFTLFSLFFFVQPLAVCYLELGKGEAVSSLNTELITRLSKR